MKLRERQTSHMIDFLFPLALFFCFAVSAIVLILMATEIYRSTTENSSRNHVGRTVLAYVSEKIHQGDEDGDVFIGTLDGEPALVLREQSENGTDSTGYCTYIYEYEGTLRELFLKEGAEVSPAGGSVIAEIESFSMEELADGLFSFVCRESSGETLTQLVSVHSKSAGGTSHE